MQCRCVVDLGLIFEANFRSEQDRVWRLYTVRALGLKVFSGTPAPTNVMELGLAYFGKAEDVWPDVIRLYGETQGWDEANGVQSSAASFPTRGGALQRGSHLPVRAGQS